MPLACSDAENWCQGTSIYEQGCCKLLYHLFMPSIFRHFWELCSAFLKRWLNNGLTLLKSLLLICSWAASTIALILGSVLVTSLSFSTVPRNKVIFIWLGSDAHFKRANRLRVECDQSGVIIVTDCLGSPPVLLAGKEGFAEKTNQIVPHCLAFL